MKVAFAADSDRGLDAKIADRFARAPYIVIVEVSENWAVKEVKTVSNPGVSASGGAAARVAQLLSNENVRVAVGPSFGPNAEAILSQMGIKTVIVQPGITVNEALERVREQLEK